jgi:hypothetical protein
MDERQQARQRLEEKLKQYGNSVTKNQSQNSTVSTNSPQDEARARLEAKLKSYGNSLTPRSDTSSAPSQTQPAPQQPITPAQPSWWESAGNWISDSAKNTWKTITDQNEKRQKETEAELKLMQEREKRGIKTPSISEPSATLNLTPETKQMLAMPIQDQPMYVVNKVNKDFLESIKQNRQELLTSGKYMNYAPNAQVTDTEKRRSESSYEIYNDIKELDEALKTGNYFTTAAKFRAAEVKGNLQVAAASFVKDLANSTLSIYDQFALTDEQKKDMQRYGSAVNNEFVKYLEDVVTENTYNDPDLGDALQQGVGSIVTMVAATLATGGGIWIPTIVESFQQAGSTYDDNIKQGKSSGDAFARSSAVFAGNIIWNRLLNKFSKVFDAIDTSVLKEAQKNFYGTLFNVGGRAGSGELVQEVGQTIGSNVAADRPWDEGIVESGIVGFTIGAGAKSIQFINLKNNEPFLEVTDFVLVEKALEQFDTNALQTLNKYSQTKVSPSSSVADIRKAFKEAAFLTNPDIAGGDPEVYKQVIRAYNDLIKIREAGVEVTEQRLISKPDGTEVTAVAQEPVTEEVAQPTPQEAKITPPEDVENERQAFKSAVFELSNAIPKNQLKEEARLNFTAFNLPESEFETLYNETIQQIEEQSQIERRQIEEVTADQNPFISDPTISQFVPTIRKALRVYDLNKRKGIDDIATISKKVSGFDGALEALTNYYGDKAQDMDFISKLYSNYLRDKDLLAQIKKETKKKLGAKKKAPEPKEETKVEPTPAVKPAPKEEKKPAEPKKKEEKKDARTKYLEEQARKKFTTKTKPQVLINETIGAVNGIVNQLQSQDENLLKEYPELKSNNIVLRINAAIKAVDDFGMNEVLDEDYTNLKRIKVVVEAKTKEEPKGLVSKIGKGYFDLTEKLTLGMKKPKETKRTKARANLDDFIIDDEDVEIQEDPLKKLYDSYDQAEKDLANSLGESGKYTNIIQMPELVQIAEQLSNNPIEIKDKLNRRGSFRGVFRSKGKDGRILLRTDLFKYPFLAQKVLSHEIGHLVDWLPDFNLSRGNILGRIGSLKSFMRDTFTNFETEKKIENLLEDLRSVQEQRRSLKVNKVVPQENKQRDLELGRRVREINKQITELQKDGIKSNVITKELRNWSYYWRNINPTEVEIIDPQFLKYIHTPEELYADAISGIFSSPLKFREFAPNFVKAFYANIDAKPQVKALYDSIQDAINSGDLNAMRNENINKAYKKSEDIRQAQALERQSMEKNLWFQIRTLFVRKETALLDFEDEKNIPIDSRASIVLGDLAYSDGFVKNLVEKSFLESYDLANSIENGWNDLGKLLFYERVIYERGELANPDGFNPETAREQFDFTLNNRSEEDRQTLLSALSKFRDGQELVLDYIKESGIYSDTLIEQMEANPAYATFQVIDYIDQNISAEIYKQEGTLKDIENPATATLMKNVSIIQSILRNDANKKLGEQMFKFDPKNVKPAEIVYDPTLKRQIVKEPKDKNLGLIKWREGGSWKGVYVDKYISDVTEKLPTQTMNMLANVSNKLLFAPLYRTLFIVWNLQFQSFNLIRDFVRLWKAIPTSNFYEAMKQFGQVAKSYKGSIKSAWARATDNYDEVVKEMEDKKILGLTYSDIITSQSEEEAQATRTLRKLGIKRGETRTGIDKTLYDFTRNQEQLAKTYDSILYLANLPNTLSDFFESIPKIAGYKMLKGTMPDAELREFIRTRIGSPAYRYKGTATPFTNNLFLFSNAIIQSVVADLKTATEPTTRHGYWYKTMVANVLPQVIKKAALAGLFGELMKEIYEKISSFDMANYGIIPIGLDENLKAIYMRLPTDPTGQIINGITWKLLNAPENGLGFDDLKEIVMTLDQVTFNFNPSIEIMTNIVDYANGRCPYDSFKGRCMIPDKEWKARNETNDAFNIFLTEIGRKMGFGIILPSNNDWQPESTLTDLQKFLSTPIINKSVGAFIKVSDYGEVERNRKLKEKLEGKRAAQNLKDDKSVEKAINDYFSQEDRSGKTKEKYFKQALRESFGKTSATTKEEISRVGSIETKFKTSLLRGKVDTKINAFIDANTNEEKSFLLLKYKGEMSKEEFAELFKNLEKYDLITQNVVDKAKEIQSGK